jgi:hypothetical protein
MCLLIDYRREVIQQDMLGGNGPVTHLRGLGRLLLLDGLNELLEPIHAQMSVNSAAKGTSSVVRQTPTTSCAVLAHRVPRNSARSCCVGAEQQSLLC